MVSIEKETEQRIQVLPLFSRSQSPLHYFYANPLYCPCRNLYQKRRFIEAKSWLPHGRINKMLSSYFYVSNALHKFPWEHGKTFPILFNHLETLAILVVLKRGIFVCLNTVGRSIYKLNFNHDCHLNSTSEMRYLHTPVSLFRNQLC